MRMFHPDLPGSASECPAQAAYDQVWQPRGWVTLPADCEHASEVLGRVVTDLNDLKVDELHYLTRYVGGQPAGRSKADAIAGYRQALDPNAVPEAGDAGPRVVTADPNRVDLDAPLIEPGQLPDLPLTAPNPAPDKEI